VSIHKLTVAAVLTASLTACASSSILVGTARPPIDPAMVRIYLDPPAEFEKVAVLEASSRNSWAVSSQQKTNKAINRMKNEAAKLGANGIIFQGRGQESSGSVGTGTAWGYGNSATGIGFSANVLHTTGSGIAIYVPHDAEETSATAQDANP
jgi:hypothetical protein